MVAPRDYYADLELPPTAEIQDVKKQYRKLGTKEASSTLKTLANMGQL